jgi:hypothetical protein
MFFTPPILIITGMLLLLIALSVAMIAWRRESGLLAMRDTPTLSVAELHERHRRAINGLSTLGEAIEVVGTIECDEPLAAPYSETVCVAYSYSVNESSERHTVRAGRPSSREYAFGGRDEQRRHVARFYVRDASGRVAIDPVGAQIDLLETVARYEAYSGIAGSERRIWREERALPLGNRVYVLGYLLSDQGEPLLGRHPIEHSRRFLISYRDEASLSSHVRLQAYALYASAIIAVAVAVAAWIAAAMRV